MSKAAANGIELEYDVHGDPGHPALLLIMGLGAQMTAWDDAFVAELAGRGLYVIRFDNRDIGLSSYFDESGVPDIATSLTMGTLPEPPYSIADMADDAAALLDALDIATAHIVGASMGGMIAQAFVLRHPERVRTLVSIMSTTGNRAVGAPHPHVAAALFVTPPPTTREEAMDAGVVGAKLIGSPGYPFDEERLRRNSAAAFDRAFHPAGMARQLAAIVTQPDRTTDLGHVSVPTLVIHGEADPLVDPSGGRATAEAIPGAELWMIPGMGHDLPPALFAEVADRIAAHTRT